MRRLFLLTISALSIFSSSAEAQNCGVSPYCQSGADGKIVYTQDTWGASNVELGLDMGELDGDQIYTYGTYITGDIWILKKASGHIIEGSYPPVATANLSSGSVPTHGIQWNNRFSDQSLACNSTSGLQTSCPPPTLPHQISGPYPVSVVKARSRVPGERDFNSCSFTPGQAVPRTCHDLVRVLTLVDAIPDGDGDGATIDEFPPTFHGTAAQKEVNPNTGKGWNIADILPRFNLLARVDWTISGVNYTTFTSGRESVYRFSDFVRWMQYPKMLHQDNGKSHWMDGIQNLRHDTYNANRANSAQEAVWRLAMNDCTFSSDLEAELKAGNRGTECEQVVYYMFRRYIDYRAAINQGYCTLWDRKLCTRAGRDNPGIPTSGGLSGGHGLGHKITAVWGALMADDGPFLQKLKDEYIFEEDVKVALGVDGVPYFGFGRVIDPATNQPIPAGRCPADRQMCGAAPGETYDSACNSSGSYPQMHANIAHGTSMVADVMPEIRPYYKEGYLEWGRSIYKGGRGGRADHVGGINGSCEGGYLCGPEGGSPQATGGAVSNQCPTVTQKNPRMGRYYWQQFRDVMVTPIIDAPTISLSVVPNSGTEPLAPVIEATVNDCSEAIDLILYCNNDQTPDASCSGCSSPHSFGSPCSYTLAGGGGQQVQTGRVDGTCGTQPMSTPYQVTLEDLDFTFSRAIDTTIQNGTRVTNRIIPTVQTVTGSGNVDIGFSCDDDGQYEDSCTGCTIPYTMTAANGCLPALSDMRIDVTRGGVTVSKRTPRSILKDPATSLFEAINLINGPGGIIVGNNRLADNSSLKKSSFSETWCAQVVLTDAAKSVRHTFDHPSAAPHVCDEENAPWAYPNDGGVTVEGQARCSATHPDWSFCGGLPPTMHLSMRPTGTSDFRHTIQACDEDGLAGNCETVDLSYRLTGASCGLVGTEFLLLLLWALRRRQCGST